MARTWYGNKRITKEDLYTKKRISSGDVRSEYLKMAFSLCDDGVDMVMIETLALLVVCMLFAGAVHWYTEQYLK